MAWKMVTLLTCIGRCASCSRNWLYWLRMFVFFISHGAVARIEPPFRAWALPSMSFTIDYWLTILLELGQYTDQAIERISVKLLLHSHWGEQIFSPGCPDWGWGLCSGGWGSFPGVRRLRNEADNSLHLVPKWRMIGIIPSLLKCLHSTHRKNFTFVITELFDAAWSELLAGSLNKP